MILSLLRAPLACALALISLAVCVTFITGCGGGSASPQLAANSKATRGTVTIRVKWPQKSGKAASNKGAITTQGRTREIPDATQSITISIQNDSGVVASTTIAPPTLSATLSDVPVGTATLQGFAYSGSGGSGDLLASGETNITVHPDKAGDESVELTAVPPKVEDPPYIIGGSVAVDDKNPNLIKITLSALINKADGKPATGLTADNFTILEDGLRRSPITVTPDSGTSSKADVAFVIDTTGSMSPEINGVVSSVVSLVQNLNTSGVDVRLAGVSFGDEIRDVKNFTTDVNDFNTWVQGLSAAGGGDTPENPLDAILTAVSSQTWRPDAQHILITITDAPAHVAGDGAGVTSQTLDSVVNSLIGQYVVYAITPGSGRAAHQAVKQSPNTRKYPFYPKPAAPAAKSRMAHTRDDGVNPDIMPIATGTGGIWLQLPGDGNIDLTTLPIGQTILNGYIVEFPARRTHKDHSIRMLVQIGGAYVADQTFPGHY